MIYATRALIEGLLEFAGSQDPDTISVNLSTTPAGEMCVADLPAESPIFTHFDLPGAGGSVSAVFGMDLGTPPGSDGRFISHPDGYLGLSHTDDLHEVVIVAIPPWEQSVVAAFGRDGSRRSLELLDVEPPEESVS